MSLFQTRAWQMSWWETWGKTPGFSLVREAMFGCSGLYLDSYRFRNLVPVNCLQFVGTNYRRLSTPRTEYNTFGLGDDQAVEALAEILFVGSWTEAVFRDIYEQSNDHRTLIALARREGWLIRTVDRDSAFSIDVLGSFGDYVKSLGSGTRLRFYNRRAVLARTGAVSLKNHWPEAKDEFFAILNEFHQLRWGVPCFNEKSLAFHKRFLTEIEREGGQPDLSVLSCAGTVVSVLYNVSFRNTMYNIQSGFLENFHRKLALGSLHLGYAIESAFRDSECYCFDLLAGGGKNESFKKHFATSDTSLISVMVVRGKLLKTLYRLKNG